MRSESSSHISFCEKGEREGGREGENDEEDTRRCDDAWPLRGLPRRWLFARAKVCPPLGNNAGESLSLDGTPRRAEPKTAKCWTEKEAGKGEGLAEIAKRKKDGRMEGERKGGREEWDAEEERKRDAEEESVPDMKYSRGLKRALRLE